MIGEVLEVMAALALDDMTMMAVIHEMGFAGRGACRVIFMDQGDVVQGDPTGDCGSSRSMTERRLFDMTSP